VRRLLIPGAAGRGRPDLGRWRPPLRERRPFPGRRHWRPDGGACMARRDCRLRPGQGRLTAARPGGHRSWSSDRGGRQLRRRPGRRGRRPARNRRRADHSRRDGRDGREAASLIGLPAASAVRAASLARRKPGKHPGAPEQSQRQWPQLPR